MTGYLVPAGAGARGLRWLAAVLVGLFMALLVFGVLWLSVGTFKAKGCSNMSFDIGSGSWRSDGWQWNPPGLRCIYDTSDGEVFRVYRSPYWLVYGVWPVATLGTACGIFALLKPYRVPDRRRLASVRPSSVAPAREPPQRQAPQR